MLANWQCKYAEYNLLVVLIITKSHQKLPNATISRVTASISISVSSSRGKNTPYDNHDSTSPLNFFTDWMPSLPPKLQYQSTEGLK